MKKIWIGIGIVILLLASYLTYRYVAQKPKTEAKNNNEVVNVLPSEGPVFYDATLYFANNEYIEKGNENLPKVLPEKRQVSIGDGSNSSRIEAVMKELMKGPVDTKKMSNSALSKVKLNGVQIIEDIAFVDFSKEKLAGGSLEEALLIEQVVKTLTSIEGINKVQFLVEGKTVETLMGHIEVANPISK